MIATLEFLAGWDIHTMYAMCQLVTYYIEVRPSLEMDLLDVAPLVLVLAMAMSLPLIVRHT